MKTALHAILLITHLIFVIAPAQAADDATTARQDAETRAAIAEAERAELLARLPPGHLETPVRHRRAAPVRLPSLGKAFDLAHRLAGDVCTTLPSDRKTTVYDPGATQGILAARLMEDAIERFGDDLGRQNKLLQQAVDTHALQGSKAGLMLPALSAVPATLRAAADLPSLFKTDAGADVAKGDEKKELAALAAGGNDDRKGQPAHRAAPAAGRSGLPVIPAARAEQRIAAGGYGTAHHRPAGSGFARHGGGRRVLAWRRPGNAASPPYGSRRLTLCSIAPNTDFPASSSISIRTMSPKRMKPVTGSPCSMVSRQRCSAMQE